MTYRQGTKSTEAAQRYSSPDRWPVHQTTAAAQRFLPAHCRPGLSQAPIPDLVKTGERRLADLYTAWGKPERAAEIHVAP